MDDLRQANCLRKGDRFEVVSEQSKGSGLFAVLGEIEISEVERETSLASVIGQSKAVESGVKIREKERG